MIFLLKLLIISLFFDRYRIAAFGDFQVTISFAVYAIILIYSVFYITINQRIVFDKSKRFILFFIIYGLFLFLLKGAQNLFSNMLMSFLMTVLLLFQNHKISEKKFNELIRLFQMLMNISVVFGLYEICSQLFLKIEPFDFIIEGFMTVGFNTGNYVALPVIGSFMRINSFFLEPSFFAQFLAINITLYLLKILILESLDARIIIIVILNAICLLFTFAGTGLLMLAIIATFFVIKYVMSSKRERKRLFHGNKMPFIILCTLVGGLIIYLTTPLQDVINNYIIRSAEFSKTGMSAYLRFTLPVLLFISAISTTFGLGYSRIGQDALDFHASKLIGSAISFKGGMGIFRIGMEYGVVGLFIWFSMLKQLYQNKCSNLFINDCRFVLLAACVGFLVGTADVTGIYIWAFFLLLSLRVKESTGNDMPIN